MGKTKLTDYFQAVDRHFQKLGPEENASVQILVQGQVIELRFLTEENAKTVACYLNVPVVSGVEKPDAVFYYWVEDCTAFMPPDSKDVTAVWQSRDETGYMRVSTNFEMIGVDTARNCYYHCRQPMDYDDYVIHGHSMASVFGRWAIQNGLLLLHSACVGVDGKGVILSARGGGGKSTLAISCLLGGFDFVSDDYILVNQKGPMKAMPLYKVIGINQDMAAILKPDMPVLRTEPRRGDKLYLDASGCEIKEELPVHAIIFPHPCDAEEPLIRPTAPGPVLSKVLDTTAKNMRVFRDPEPYRIMAARLNGLPVYEFCLTRDLERNREYFRDFIKNLL